MFQVKAMTAKDFQFAVSLANTMNWSMTIEDFKFNSSLEPEGCLVLFDGTKRVGIATCINFGKIGWFGNLIVEEKYRHQGAGSHLVKHALNYLQERGVETVGLYAYKHLIDFYSKFGFKADRVFLFLVGNGFAEKLSRQPVLAEVKDASELIKFDSVCFGASREKLLGRILQKGNLCYFSREKSEVVGYVAAKVYEGSAEVGPLMCQANRLRIAVELLKAVLAKLKGKSVYVCLPKQETKIVNLLFEKGFSEQFTVARMFLGLPPSRHCISIAESLERG